MPHQELNESHPIKNFVEELQNISKEEPLNVSREKLNKSMMMMSDSKHKLRTSIDQVVGSPIEAPCLL